MTNRDLVRDFLQQEGYKFDENDELFHFRAQGMHLVCEAGDRDDMFVRIIAPVIYSISDHPDVSRESVLEVCNRLVEKIKTLKVYVDRDGDVMLAVELFIAEQTQDLSAVLERSLNVLGQGRFDFAKHMQED